MTVNINKTSDFSTKLLRNAKALNGRTTNYHYYKSTNGSFRMLPQVEAKDATVVKVGENFYAPETSPKGREILVKITNSANLNELKVLDKLNLFG